MRKANLSGTTKAARLVFAAVAISLIGCGDPSGPSEPVAASVSVTLSRSTVHPTEQLQALATVRDATGNAISGLTVAWSTSAPEVATIAASGVASAVALGNAKVIASVSGVSGDATLSVVEVPVAAVTIALPPPTLLLGQAVQLAAVTTDSAGGALAGRVVNWSSSDDSKASVSSTGLVTAMAVGSVTITATSEGKSGSASVTIQLVPVASVVVSPSPASLIVSQTLQLAAVTKDSVGGVLPGRATSWASSDQAKATVSNTGLVTAISVGTVTITATSEGRAGVASITSTVGAPAKLIVKTPPSPSAQSGVVIGTQPVIQVADAFGNSVGQTGISITSSIASGGGSLNGLVTAMTDATGKATFTDLRISGVVGVRSLAFSAPNLSSANSAVTLLAGPASTVTVKDGNSQTALVTTAVAIRPTVQVSDADDNPVAGVSLTFAIASGGGSVFAASQTTNGSGIATVGSWVLGPTVGTNTMTATASGLPAAPVVFSATATAPTGVIAFFSDRTGPNQIYSMNVDGSGSTQLTTLGDNLHPVWSPDGSAIAWYSSGRDQYTNVYRMAADGSSQTKTTFGLYSDAHPTWSPDGLSLAYQCGQQAGFFNLCFTNIDGSQLRSCSNIFEFDPEWSPNGQRISLGNLTVVNADCSGHRQVASGLITGPLGTASSAAWSPGSDKLVFTCWVSQICTINLDGTGYTKLTEAGNNDFPSWSPDGKLIVFSSTRDTGKFQLYIMNSDGTNVRRITNSTGNDRGASWKK